MSAINRTDTMRENLRDCIEWASADLSQQALQLVYDLQIDIGLKMYNTYRDLFRLQVTVKDTIEEMINSIVQM